jgi:RNA polymerase sigma-70 factor (ECF subfamily)
MRSDGELIALYRAGDQDAFKEFYGRHRRQLYLYLLSMVRNRETAEELMQETFFAFLRHLDRLNGSPNLRPFLVKTARNRAIDLLRRSRRYQEALEARAQDPLFKPRGEGSPPAVDPERMTRLLSRLPREQREAVVLKVFLGLTFQEIAELTGCPPGSVVSRYRYGIEKLRASFPAGGLEDGTGRNGAQTASALRGN